MQNISTSEIEKPRLYHPLNSLKKALENWMPYYFHGSGPAVPPLVLFL